MVEAVNFNSPGQVVIAGDKAAVLRAIEDRQGAGRKTRRRTASERALAQQPDEVRRRAARRATGDNGNSRAAHPLPQRRGCARARCMPTTSAQLLVRQLSSPVRWTATVAALGSGGRAADRRMRPGRACSPAWSSASHAAANQTFALEDSRQLCRGQNGRVPDRQERKLTHAAERHRAGYRRFPRNWPGHRTRAGRCRRARDRHRHQRGRSPGHQFVAWKQRSRCGAGRRQRGFDRRAVSRPGCPQRDAHHPGEQRGHHARHACSCA